MIADPKQGTTHTHFKTWITVSLRDRSSEGPRQLGDVSGDAAAQFPYLFITCKDSIFEKV